MTKNITATDSAFSLLVQEKNLRKCQRLGYQALRNHFSQSNSERIVLIQLPTGTGKSVLLGVAPFGLATGKTLIVTPNLKLVRQIKEDLDLQEINNKYEALELFSRADLSKLKSELYLLVLDNTANSGDVVDNQILVANFQQLYDLDKWFLDSKDVIDLVIIDEAHHQAADTYQNLINYFPKAKVVGLTGTPFRTDGKQLEGKRIYKYSYEDAINDGVIRNFSHHDVMPHEVRLDFQDSTKKHYSLDQILDLSEETWFQKKVSLSEDCCDSIAAKAFEKLQQLRKDFPNEQHQIIASAMTIRHAREQVKNAFQKLGLKVGLVSSAAEEQKTNEQVFDQLKANKLDVIINVGMLGEGFDHKNLGVAAIFRPYKSLNPYIQFIGRVIRKNGATQRAYLVSHAGLNQVSRFKEFKLFDNDEQAYLQGKLFSDHAACTDKPFVDESPVVKEDNSLFLESKLHEVGSNQIETQHDFVNQQALESLVEQIKQLNPESTDLLASLLSSQAPDLIKSFQKSNIHPTNKRKAARSKLFESSKSLTMDIARELDLKQPMKTRTFNPLYNDFKWITQRVNKKIKEMMVTSGVPSERTGNRRLLRNEDYLAIDEQGVLLRVKQDCLAHFKNALAKKTNS